jgi:hypothetical protein
VTVKDGEATVKVAEGKALVKPLQGGDLQGGDQAEAEVLANQQTSLVVGQAVAPPVPAQFSADEQAVFERLNALSTPDPKGTASPTPSMPTPTPTRATPLPTGTPTPTRATPTPTRATPMPTGPTSTPARLP